MLVFVFKLAFQILTLTMNYTTTSCSWLCRGDTEQWALPCVVLCVKFRRVFNWTQARRTDNDPGPLVLPRYA